MRDYGNYRKRILKGKSSVSLTPVKKKRDESKDNGVRIVKRSRTPVSAKDSGSGFYGFGDKLFSRSLVMDGGSGKKKVRYSYVGKNKKGVSVYKL